MGGLKKHLPITYWTFLVSSLAIAGVPGLAGFFSKDEILYETFHHGHWILWGVGIITSLLTATYMFRLVFLTFHGAPRHEAPAAADHGHADDHGHGHGHAHGAPHDAPWPMALALIVLAVGSVAAGYIGIPHALGGHNVLGTWLAPAFAVPGAEIAEVEADIPLELTLMAVSSIIALLGIGIAAFIWLKRREIAETAARNFAGAHRLLLNKYYVDEVYDAAVVQPIRVISQEGLWRGFDVKVIDGAVNGVASIVGSGAYVMRRLQTGSVRAYASSLFVGVVLIIGYYLWR
jgi:NADH-quinone oxidoreductase subunit L